MKYLKYKQMFWHLSGGGRGRWLLRAIAVVNSHMIEFGKAVPYLPIIMAAWIYSKIFRHAIICNADTQDAIKLMDVWVQEETDIKYWLYTYTNSSGFTTGFEATFYFISAKDAAAFKLRWV